MSLSFTPRQRLLALVGVAVLLWYARNALNPDAEDAAKPARSSRAPAVKQLRGGVPVATLDEVCTTSPVLAQRGTLVSKVGFNPFASPPPPVVVQRKVAPVPVVVAPPVEPPPPPPPPPPKLPYKFVGFFDDPGSPPTVFLAVGNNLIHARVGDTLEGGFKLQSINRRELVFIHIERQITLRMPIEGDIS